MKSYWEKAYWFEKTDITIVGCGLVGLFTALFLKERRPHLKIQILERANMPQGASTKNAGFACFGTVGEIIDDLGRSSKKQLIEIVKLRWEGLKLLKSIVPLELMDYKEFGGMEVFDNKNSFESCAASKDLINAILFEATGLNKIIEVSSQATFKGLYSKTLFNSKEGQLNPVKLVKYLVDKVVNLGVKVHFGCGVQAYEASAQGCELLTTDNMHLLTQKTIFTTNAFSKAFFPGIDMIPYRNQVLISKPISKLKLNGCFHYHQGYIYFRNVADRILIGGARHLDMNKEQTLKFGHNEYLQTYLLDFIKKISLLELTVDSKWSGIIATGESKMPICELLDNNVYAALRLGGMGVSTGAGVARKISQLVLTT